MIEYILKSSAAIAATYILYYLFVRRNTNFKWLRIYFLTALLLSLILPALKYVPNLNRRQLVSIPTEMVPIVVENEFYNVDISTELILKTNKPKVTVFNIVTYIYVTGLLFVLFRFLFGVFHLLWLVARYGVFREGRSKIVPIPNLSSPFSFFQFIFIDNCNLHDVNKSLMFRHEQSHVRYRHSIDLLLLEIIVMLQWFNPFAWFTRKALKEIHEFQADDHTLSDQVSPLLYQQLLLQQACGFNSNLPANGFNSSLTKKRILMITNNNRNRKWFKVFAILIVAIFITDSFNRIGILKAAPNLIKSKIINGFVDAAPKSEPNQNLKTTDQTVMNEATKLTDKIVDSSQAATKNCIVHYDTVASPLKSDSLHRTVIAKVASGNYGYDISIASPPYYSGTNCLAESQKAYISFIKQNLKYPDELINSLIANRTGIVNIRFKIDSLGKVQNVTCSNDELRNYYKDADVKFKDYPEKLNRIKQDLSRYTDNPILVKEAFE
jgi:hypothetical protein